MVDASDNQLEAQMKPMEGTEMMPQMLLKVMVVTVAHNRGLVGLHLKGWMDAVMFNLIDVGVVSLWSFIVGVLELNLRLERAGHRRFHGSALGAMMVEASEMIFLGEAVEPESEVQFEEGAQGAAEFVGQN
jgi:hypothetical protein